MKINICYLYSDLLNLYGELGNIKALEYQLLNQNIKVNIDKLSIEDKINFNKYDLIYIGSGTEDNINIVYNHLKDYKEDIINEINNNKFFLITGNASDLFTKDYLNIFNINIINKEKRYVKELKLSNNIIKEDIYGLINRNGYIKTEKDSLFEKEGILKNNFYLTTLIGPLLIKNPKFLEYFIKQLIKSKDKNFKFKKFDLELEKKAYQSFIKFKENKKNKFKE